jgi:hypothetical protein
MLLKVHSGFPVLRTHSLELLAIHRIFAKGIYGAGSTACGSKLCPKDRKPEKK